MVRRLACLLPIVLLLFSPRAHAQDDWAVYGADDPEYVDIDNGPTPKALRKMKALMIEFSATNVNMAAYCVLDPGQRISQKASFTITWSDEEDDARCNRIVELVAAIAALGGTNIYADAVIAWCSAAEVVEMVLPKVENMLNNWAEQKRQGFADEHQRYRNWKIWHEEMDVYSRTFFMWFEQVAVRLILYNIGEL